MAGQNSKRSTGKVRWRFHDIDSAIKLIIIAAVLFLVGGLTYLFVYAAKGTIASGQSVLASASYIVAVFGGMMAAAKAVSEMRESRLWKSAEVADKYVQIIMFDDKNSVHALQLLDFPNTRVFKSPTSEAAMQFNAWDVVTALRCSDQLEEMRFDEKEMFVRLSFDALFEHFSRLELSIRSRRILVYQVESSLQYYVGLMNSREEFRRYATFYGNWLAAEFMERFETGPSYLEEIEVPMTLIPL